MSILKFNFKIKLNFKICLKGLVYIYNQSPKMDLKQRKLSKSEWESIEIPVSANENEILKLNLYLYQNYFLLI